MSVVFTGGTFGLWVGWTVMTVFEFVELAVDLLALSYMKRKQTKSSASKVTISN